jgi:hypothetical protein
VAVCASCLEALWQGKDSAGRNEGLGRGDLASYKGEEMIMDFALVKEAKRKKVACAHDNCFSDL